MNGGNQSSFSGRRFGGPLLPAGLLVLAILVVFGQVCRHEFLMYDDEPHVLNNPRLNPVTWWGVGRFWVEESYWGLYIPLSYTFFAAEASIAGQPLNPAVFHLGNLALHIACVLLVFTILRRLFRHDGAACAGALLFGLHPVQVESVAWISETRGVLCGVFSLLAIWQYLCCAGTFGSRRRFQLPTGPIDNSSATGVASYSSETDQGGEMTARAIVHYVLATAALILALLSKPAAVAVPLIVLVLELGLLHSSIRRMLSERSFWLRMLGVGLWLIVAAGWTIWTKRLQPDTLRAFVPPLSARPLVAGDALTFYMYKLVAPVWCGPDYGRSPAWVIGQSWSYATWLLPATLPVALACLRNRRLWLTAAGVFIAWLLPVLGLLPFDFQRISTVADRYLYLSLLGPALALSWLLASRWNRRTIGVTIAILSVLGVLSLLQTSHWRNNTTLIAHGLRVNPHSVLATHHRGALLNREGKHEEAVTWYRKALADHPQHEEAHISLAKSLVILEQVDEAEKALREAWRAIPKRPRIHCELADVLVKRGKIDEAEDHYRTALELDPKWAPAYLGLGKLWFDRGATDVAIEWYRKVLDVDPNYVEAHVNLAAVLETQGKVLEARYHYRAALRIRPDWPVAHFNLANLERAQGAIDAAVWHYRAALKYYPNYAKAHVELGIILFDRGATAEAIRHYQEALQIDPDLVEAHIHLGHARAAQGRYEEAAAAYRAALDLVPPNSEEAQRIREFLRPYESR